jgi:hypothetical protein
VSSLYRILCLSHDPAIVIPDLEWANSTGMECALAHVESRDFDDTLYLHRTCDLMGGRYSYPLIEVYCPPFRESKPSPCNRHSDGQWIDAHWLRLLSAVHTSFDVGSLSPITTAVGRIDKCWSKDRLRRLRVELQADEWWTP